MTPACRALKGFVVKDVAWASAGIPKVSSVFLCRSLGEITPGTQAISQTGRKTIHHHRRPTKNQNLNLMFRSLRSLISAQEQFLRTERAHGARWARKWRVALTFQNRRPPPPSSCLLRLRLAGLLRRACDMQNDTPALMTTSNCHACQTA